MMDISNLLALLDIFVVIFFGFFFTHWYSVRDARTRAIKDYYISALNDIRKKLDDFFQNILEGKSSSKKIAYWYPTIQTSIINFDNGLRLALPIKKMLLDEIIDTILSDITKNEYINENYSKQSLTLDINTRDFIISKKKIIDEFLNEYLIQVNNISAYCIVHTVRQSIELDTEYYEYVKHCKRPRIMACWKSFTNNKGNIILWLVAIGCLISFCILFTRTNNGSFANGKPKVEEVVTKSLTKGDNIKDVKQLIDNDTLSNEIEWLKPSTY